MLKAVLMDIDDTLLDFGKCAEQAMRIGFAEWGLPYDDSTYATFTRINDSLWLMIERGELTTQQLFEFPLEPHLRGPRHPGRRRRV